MVSAATFMAVEMAADVAIAACSDTCGCMAKDWFFYGRKSSFKAPAFSGRLRAIEGEKITLFPPAGWYLLSREQQG